VQVVICAYNAGEGNVSLWLNDKTKSKDGETLVVVPFLETQNYLNKILKARKKYIKLYPKILDKQNNIS
jgi:soluble lytic murein transglycosylase